MANFICDHSGFKFPLSQAVRQWNGLLVHHRFADKRNPQDFVTPVPDNKPLRQSRPEPADTFLSPGDVTPSDL